MTADFKRDAKDDDRGIGVAPIFDTMIGKAKQTAGRRTAVKPGDITEALAEIRRDPTAVARHHLGREPGPAPVEAAASVAAPAADPEATDTAGSPLPVTAFETEPVDAAEPSAPIQAAESEPDEPAEQPPAHAAGLAAAPADLAADPAAVVDPSEAESIGQAEQPAARTDSVEVEPIAMIGEPAASSESLATAPAEPGEPSPPPADSVDAAASAEPAPAEHDAQGLSSRMRRVLNRLRGQQRRNQARQEPTMPVPPAPEVEAVPDPIGDGASDRHPTARDAESTPETPETPEMLDEPAPDPSFEPVATPAPETTADADPSTDIVAYWEELRFGRMLPAWADLDPYKIAACWPNSLLMRYLAENERLQLEPSFAELVRNNRADDVEVEPIDYTPMVTEWVIGVGRTAVELGQPTEDTEVFPSMGGQVGYRVVALPLSDDQTAVDHVLCHVSIA